LPLKTREQDRGEPQLPDDALKSGSDLRRCHRHRDGQEFSPGALPREGTHSYARKRVTTPTGITVVGVKMLSFRSKKPSHYARYLRPPTVPEPSLPNTIWELPLRKCCQHQVPCCPLLAIYGTKEQGHHHCACRRSPHSPPSEAAAPMTRLNLDKDHTKI
jgi:hypothetical protein